MKKLLSICLALFTLIFLNSCLKDKGFENNEYGIAPTGVNAEPFVQILGGGLAKFTNGLIKPNTTDTLNIADTVEFRVFYVNNGKPTDKDIVITLAPSPTALAAYNAIPGNSVFEIFPDSVFTFTKRTVTVKAGESFSELTRVIYNPRRIDKSKLYLLPISIVDAQGVKISSNNGTIYFNIIGNPLAGVYSVVGRRYNYAGVIGYTGGPIPGNTTSTANSPTTKTILAIDGKKSMVDYANLGAGTGRDYIFTYDPAVSTTDLKATFSATFLANISNVKIITITYDPVLRKIYVLSTYNNQLNAAGDDRIVEETFTRVP